MKDKSYKYRIEITLNRNCRSSFCTLECQDYSYRDGFFMVDCKYYEKLFPLETIEDISIWTFDGLRKEMAAAAKGEIEL